MTVDYRYMGGVKRRRVLCRLFGCRFLPGDTAAYSVFGAFCVRCGRKWL